MPHIRIDRIIRGAGLAPRREILALIQAGRVTVDSETVTAIAQRFDPAQDIRLDGRPVVMEPPVCLMLHKPAGYLTATVSDKEPPVTALLPPAYRGFFPVGRLDLDAEGLLLLTNDGDLCHRIIMPSCSVVKEYYVEVTGSFAPDTQARFLAGLEADNGLRCLPARIDIAPDGRSAHVFVTEGKRHQVKRMVAAAGARVRYLKRLAIGGLRLDASLPRGAYRILSDAEIASIFTPRNCGCNPAESMLYSDQNSI